MVGKWEGGKKHYAGMLECWNAGMLGLKDGESVKIRCWNAGMLECWNAEMKRNAGMRECWDKRMLELGN